MAQKSLEKIGTKKLVTVGPRDSISQAWVLMQENSIRHLPVLDDKKVVGILSDRDIQRATKIKILDDFNNKVMIESLDSNLIVADFMGWPVITVSINQPVSAAIDLLLQNKVSSLLVVEKQELKGILTTHDLLDLLKELVIGSEFSTIDQLKIHLSQTPMKIIVDTLSRSGI